MTTKSKALIQITRSKTAIFASEADLESARSEFNHRRCMRLPAFLGEGLLQEIQADISNAKFYDRRDKGIALESCMKKNTVFNLLHFLLNDGKLFQSIQKITGCRTIGCFGGRLYRMIPGQGYYDSWHDDMDGKRLIGLSINLSPEAYEGGTFQIRDLRYANTTHQIHNTGVGDAILFRLSDDLKHRVDEVKGSIPKIAFAGWFQSKPTVLNYLKRSAVKLSNAVAAC